MLKITIGSKIINKVGNQGVIISVDKYNNFIVDFGDRKVSYSSVAFTNGFLKFTNAIEQEQVEAEIENIANRKVKEKEAQRISIEKNKAIENKNKDDKKK